MAFSAVGRDAWLSIDSCTLPRLTAEDAKNAEHFADADLDHVDQSKAENHAAAVALIFPWCNFVRVHQTLRVTPAMEAGIADHFWSLDELVGLLDAGTAPMAKFVVNRTNRVITL